MNCDMTLGGKEIFSTYLIFHPRSSGGGRDEESKIYQEKEMNKPTEKLKK